MCLVHTKQVIGLGEPWPYVGPETANEPILVYKELVVSGDIKSLSAAPKYVTPYMFFQVKFVGGKCVMGDGTMTGTVDMRKCVPSLNPWPTPVFGSLTITSSDCYSRGAMSSMTYDIASKDTVMTVQCVRSFNLTWKDGRLDYDLGAGISERFDEYASSVKVSVNEGIHAHAKPPVGFVGFNKDLPCYCWEAFPAVIPAGAHYFRGDDGDIVADKMIVYKDEKSLRKDYDIDEKFREMTGLYKLTQKHKF